MRTPVVLIAGQGPGDDIADVLLRGPGTAVIGYTVAGHVAVRRVSGVRNTRLVISEWPLETANGCTTCAIRKDLMTLLRQLHRSGEVHRIVVRLMPWMDVEPICVAINDTVSGDVTIEAVLTGINSGTWLQQALGDADLDTSRTVAQVVVGQAEFADVLVLTAPDRTTLAVLRRLAPRARITVGLDRVEPALAHIEAAARRGRSDEAHDPLLAGEPPLRPDGEVCLLEFNARRPFHPQRLHHAIDALLDGVVRIRGRAWLAGQPDSVLWIESAGGGLGVATVGRWLAAMPDGERSHLDPERTALAAAHWDDTFGDRHIALTALLCGALPDTITEVLTRALLTDDELDRPGEWAGYPDPFGDWHEDPCENLQSDLQDGLAPADEGEQ